MKKHKKKATKSNILSEKTINDLKKINLAQSNGARAFRKLAKEFLQIIEADNNE